jgi:hypothetical protein
MKKQLLREISRAANALRANRSFEMLESATAYIIGKGCAADYRLSGEIEALSRVLPSNPVIFDVGANNGEWAIALAKHLSNPVFYLFECAPICITELKQRLPRLPNSKLLGSGLVLVS